ncbi:MAG: hypothetical protein WKG00_38385 [Polyangiaceae bacterium]
MKAVQRYGLVAGLSGLVVAGAFFGGIDYAADARLEVADGAVEKAIALLEAAQNPGNNPPFGGHRFKAVVLLKQARTEIEKAQKSADTPPKPDKPNHPGGGDKHGDHDHDHDKDKGKKK